MHKHEELDVGLITASQSPDIALDGRTSRRRRRFSQGIERVPSYPSTLRVGRFSDGLERSPRSRAATRLGSFADGTGKHPQPHLGSFANGFDPPPAA